MSKFLPFAAAVLFAFVGASGMAHAQNSNPFAKAASSAALVTIGPSCSPVGAGCNIIPVKAKVRA